MMHPSPVDLNDIVRGISANHTFLDGNKIAGTACAWTFFYLNGYEVDENHDAELADMILDLFCHRIDNNHFQSSFGSLLNGSPQN